MAILEISCFGSLRIVLSGSPVVGFATHKARALLVYLAVESSRPHARDTLAGLLWPDVSQRTAAANLRRSLYNLRTVIGDRGAATPCLQVTRQRVAFDLDSGALVDVLRFGHLVGSQGMRLAHVDDLREAARLYKGEFLEGFSLAASAPFEEWVVLFRERLHRQYIGALGRLAAHCEAVSDYEGARGYAWRLLELESWDEQAHRTLMRALALSGRRADAVAQYAACCRVLEAELGVEPSAETTKLYEQIRRDELEFGETRPFPTASAVLPRSRVQGGVRLMSSPFVDREEELGQLQDCLHDALGGDGQLVFVTGEPGSGKTALVTEFVHRLLPAHANLIAADGLCSAQTGTGDPYLPFSEILRTLSGDVQGRISGDRLGREQARRLRLLVPKVVESLLFHGPDLVDRLVPGQALLERASSLGGETAPCCRELEALLAQHREPGLSGQLQSALFSQYTAVLRAIAAQAPLALFVDDLQWADAGSVGLLFHLARRLGGSRIMLVAAYRCGDLAMVRDGERNPLDAVLHELGREAREIKLGASEAAGRCFVRALLADQRCPDRETFSEAFYQHTGGNPLFATELLRILRERGDLLPKKGGQEAESPRLDWDALPPRVQTVIAERVAKLSTEERALMRIACVEGQEFTAQLIADVHGYDENRVIDLLSGPLSHRHALVTASYYESVAGRSLARYRFRHHLYWAYLYGALDAVERAHLHARVGDALEALFAQSAERAAEAAPQLARHHEIAGRVARAVEWLGRAGERASQLSANDEAIAHYEHALSLLPGLDDGRERAEWELQLCVSLISPYTTARGYASPETHRVSSRARDLTLELGDMSGLFPAMYGLWTYHLVSARIDKARITAEQCLDLAQSLEEREPIAAAHYAMGFCAQHCAEFRQVCLHMEAMLAAYDPAQHHTLRHLCGYDVRPLGMTVWASALWRLGYPDRADRITCRAVALARELGHAHTIAATLGIAAVHYQARGDANRVVEYASDAVATAEAHSIPYWTAAASILLGWAQVRLGNVAKGLALMRRADADYPLERNRMNRAGQLAWFADAYARAGDVEKGLALVAQAQEELARTGARFMSSELQRLEGELLFRLDGSRRSDAETSFCQAIELARSQEAKSLEIGATVSLCKLLVEDGRCIEARDRLEAIYESFSEGFDTPDLRAARALLQELSAGISSRTGSASKDG